MFNVEIHTFIGPGQSIHRILGCIATPTPPTPPPPSRFYLLPKSDLFDCEIWICLTMRFGFVH